MEKLRFTQLFHESEKVSKDEEKFKIILEALPDDEKAEVEEDYVAAKFNNKLEEFFDEYKDILDNAQTEESNDDTTSETDSSNEIESSDEKPTEDENLDSDNTNSDVEADEESEEQLEMEEESASGQDSTIKNGKSSLNLSNKYYNKLVETLKITPDMEKDFEKYEEYFGYTSTGKKDSVKVMFRTPEYWPIKTGDYIKSDNPLFHTVACMNEFLIWRMGVQIYNKEYKKEDKKENKIKGIFNTVLKSGKAGSALNAYVKKHADETKENIAIAIEEIRTGSTVIDDPFETGKDIKQKNNIILFMFTKIFPTLLNVAKTGTVGGKFASATSKILGEDNLYGKLYLIGRSEYKLVTSDDVLNDLILDSYSAFLGGRLAVRAPYESEIKGSARFGTAVAKPLCIFDNNWLKNESDEAKNIYQKMDTAFSEKNEKFEIKVARKKGGTGAIKAIGLSKEAYSLAIQGATDETLQFELEQDNITQKDVDDVKKARQYITIETIELEPFAYIANTVGADFHNFLSCLTRVGAAKVGILDVYDKKYYSEEDIKNEKDPKKKEEMLEINKRWEEASIKIRNFDPMSLSTPTQGKDGDTGNTIGDMVAAPGNLEDQANTKIELNDEFANIENIIKDRNKKISQAIKEGDDSKTIGSAFYSMLKMEQMLYASFTWLNFSPRNAFDFAFGKWQRPDGTFKGVSKVQKWTSLAVDSWGGKSVNGTKSHPYFGLGHTVIPTEDFEPNRNTLIDSLYKLHNKIGLWYLNTPEGNKAREDFITFLKNTYDNTIADFKDFVRPIQGRLHSSDVNLTEYVQSLGLMGALWRPNFSTVSDDITVGARGVYGDGPIAPDYQTIYDATNEAKSWVIAAITKPITNESFDVLLNPRSKNRESNSIIVEKIKDLTGINLYSFWDDSKQQADAKSIRAAFKAWSDLTGNHFDLRDNTTNKAALSIDDIPNVLTSKNALLGSKHVTPSKNKPYDQHDLVVSQTDDLLNKHRNFMNQESLEIFFGEVFREASEKEKTKKQRFTIN